MPFISLISIPLEKKLKDEQSVDLIHTVPELTDLRSLKARAVAD